MPCVLELARVLKRFDGQLRYGLRFCWWPGHSHGRYSGSTWYADTNWHDRMRGPTARRSGNERDLDKRPAWPGERDDTWLVVNFQEVVHSAPAVNAYVAKQAVIRRGARTLTRMRL
jgi:hypothetical protein